MCAIGRSANIGERQLTVSGKSVRSPPGVISPVNIYVRLAIIRDPNLCRWVAGESTDLEEVTIAATGIFIGCYWRLHSGVPLTAIRFRGIDYFS